MSRVSKEQPKPKVTRMNAKGQWPSVSEFRALFSPDPVERFNSSMQYGQAYPNQMFAWPYACWGAANAWLVLLGPSPGKPHAGDIREAGPENRTWDQRPKIGEQASEVKFGPKDRRNSNFEKISRAGFGSNFPEHIPIRLTAMLNLDGGHARYGNEIALEHLRSGCDLIFDRLIEAKPRVVVALSYAAWEPFTCFLASKAFTPLSPPAVYPNGKCLLAAKFKISAEINFETLILKSRQHPSMPFFKAGVDDEAIQKTVDWFLQQ